MLPSHAQHAHEKMQTDEGLGPVLENRERILDRHQRRIQQDSQMGFDLVEDIGAY